MNSLSLSSPQGTAVPHMAWPTPLVSHTAGPPQTCEKGVPCTFRRACGLGTLRMHTHVCKRTCGHEHHCDHTHMLAQPLACMHINIADG